MLLGALAILTATAGPLRGDEILIRATGEGSRVLRRQAEVTEYTGRQLTARLPDGRVENFDLDRLVRVTPSKSSEHAAGDRLRLQGRFADALAAYRQARRKEPRDWVRRLLLTHEATCYAAEGQIRYAGDTFLSVVRSDPATPYFAAIPLPWIRSRADADVEQAAAEWLDRRDLPAARLLGAAWLLGSPRRAVALETLRLLTSDSDPRVALLAEAQLWRAEYVTAPAEEVRRWSRRVAAMPAELRPGPYYVVGLGLARHGQHHDAALAWLRLPILYPDRYRLAAASLWKAADSLHEMGQTPEAVGLLQEIIDRYAASEVVGRARERIAELEHVSSEN